jgi:hypothetical protein
MADTAIADVPFDSTRNEVAKLLLWHGNKSKDTILPPQLIKRVETAKDSCDWADRHTMVFVNMALKNDALEWFDGLKIDGVDKQVNQKFKVAFFCVQPARAARTAILNIHDLNQGPSESVVIFQTRVINAANDIEVMLPPEARTPTENRYGT